MSGFRNLFMIFIVFGGAITAVELFMNGRSDGTLLMTLTYWTMFAQGTVAAAAIAEASKGVWFIPVKRDLLSFYPMTFFMAFLYLLIGLRMDIYPWMEHPTVWLSKNFFIIRNFAMMLLVAWTAHVFARAAMRDDPSRHRHAVVYIMLWVVSISLVAFDWLMSLEYPFINTLFGGFYFIQSFLMGLATTAFVIAFRVRGGDKRLKETLRDTGTMMFTFSFMWGGFLFTQYLVIWYGNLPEEVGYILKRVSPSPYWGLSRVMLALMFVIPFLSLLSRKLKTIPPLMVLVACSSFAGMIVEQIIVIAPAAPINSVAVAVQFALMLILAVVVYKVRNSFMPQYVVESAGGGRRDDSAGDLATAHNR